MTKDTSALLWEYVEGKLEGDELLEVERMVRHDPERRAELRKMERQHEILSMVDGAVLYEPVPKRLTDVIRRARKNES